MCEMLQWLTSAGMLATRAVASILVNTPALKMSTI